MAVCQRVFAVLWLLIIGLLFSASAQSSGPLKVVVSIKPVHSIVAGLMRDVAEPVLLIDQDRSPFDFVLNKKDREDLAEAALVIWVGPELEHSIASAVGRLSGSKVVELLSSQRLKILPSRENPDRRDPFFWMDDRNMMILLDELTELLIEKDPARSHIYSRNRREMIKPLQRIDREYEYGYRGLKAGVGVLYFDTLRYFEQAYALKTLGHVTGTPWDSEKASNLLQIRNVISSGQAKCLFIDKSMHAKNQGLILQGQGINVGELDVLGAGFKAGPGLYLQLMDYNTDTIKQCLNADMKSAAIARKAATADGIPALDGLGGRFLLQDHQGGTFTDQDLKGRYSLVYFGYTHCPDICPTGLTVISQALRKMGDAKLPLQPIFITVDPERDTVRVMKDYVRYFDPRMVGLTGSTAMVKRVADQFKVKFEKVPSDIANPQEYAMDHSAGTYLMAPDGSFITKFAQGITADAMAKEIWAIIR